MRAPEFWSHDAWLSRALAPLGGVYAVATRRRLARSPSYRAPIPVICVGNVTAGGSGKTPTVQALVKCAARRGVAVQCLSRGYGGNLKGPVRVDPALHGAADVGDEPLLLAALAPTWIACDRAAGARAAVAAGAELLILDDGLQNPALAYDLSLLVIDGGYGFGNGRCIPAGPLREPVARAAARAGAAILIGDDVKNSAAQLPAGLPLTRAAIVPQENNLSGKKVVAFAGLGRPEKFRDMLLAMGADIIAWHAFSDHHVFSTDSLEIDSDLKILLDFAEMKNAVVVTTEKDFVRLPLYHRDRVQAVAIDLISDDPQIWDRLLDKVLT